MVLLGLGLANIAAAIYFFRRLPANILAFPLARIVAGLSSGSRSLARSASRSAKTPNIIVVDHVSWLDAPILFSLMETPATS